MYGINNKEKNVDDKKKNVEEDSVEIIDKKILDVVERYFDKNAIWIEGEITRKTLISVISQIDELVNNQEVDVINVNINSFGGDNAAGMRIVFELVRLLHVRIQTMITGYAAGVASILFMSGDERIMMPNTYLSFYHSELKRYYINNPEAIFCPEFEIGSADSCFRRRVNYLEALIYIRTRAKIDHKTARKMILDWSGFMNRTDALEYGITHYAL